MPAHDSSTSEAQRRYAVYGEIASGGMASILYARLQGYSGFSRPVVFKKLHPHFAKDTAFVAMFLDEARISARIAHANVVATLDVLQSDQELAVVLEYVHGESLARLLSVANACGQRVPVRIATSVLAGVLHGLHAAHDTCGENGEPLAIVHRDVSPENILVGEDGVARILDFGIAKAQGSRRLTPTGEVKGKLAYMAHEQFRGARVDRRTDVYGAAVVLWETLVGTSLFTGASDAALIHAVLEGEILPPSCFEPDLPAALDAIVMRGLSRNPAQRFASAREMALALEREVGVATQSEVADWLDQLAGDLLRARSHELKRMQSAAPTASAPSSGQGTRKISVPPAREAQGRDAARERPRRGVLSASLVLLGGASLAAAVWALALQSAPAESGVFAHVLPALVRLPPSTVDHAPVPSTPAEVAAPASPSSDPKPIAPPVESVALSELVLPELVPAALAEQESPRRAIAPRARYPRPRARAALSRRDAPVPPLAEVHTVDCSPPYQVDALGIRRLKRECL